VSVWLRYLALWGVEGPFPANAYQGDYIIPIAQGLYQQAGERFKVSAHLLYQDLPLDEPEGGDKELYIDALITRAKTLLKPQDYAAIFNTALTQIMADIREDLAEFGVEYDHWFSEREFVASGVVSSLLQKLTASGYAYEKEGAIWFKSTDFGDVKDRVLIRSNGQHTYFANDVAYHLNKFERGFDLLVDILGSDHHGYLTRMKAAVSAAQINQERLIQLLVQFVSLYRGSIQVPMSTRGGQWEMIRHAFFM
jgi:arginyl-tRNA synthetase